MTKIHIVGAGTPNPTADRFGSAYVAEVGTQQILIDCGPATTWKLVRAGLSPAAIDTLFFTHHHYDHDVDYPCFVLNRWGHHDWGDLNPLKVYGPNHTETLTDRILNPEYGAWAPDWTSRTKHPASLALYENNGGKLPRRGPDVRPTDIEAGTVIEGDGWTIRTAVAEHFQPYLDSLAYRLDTDAGSVVFTGDTRPCRSVEELAQGADVLIAMCWDLQDELDKSPLRDGQSGTRDAGSMAREAGVGKLVLTHVEPQIGQDPGRTEAIADAASVFSGEVVLADEMTVLTI